AGDGRQVVLSDREPELRLVDLHPGGVERVQQRQRVRDLIAPAAVPQLDGDGESGERAQQPYQILARARIVLEAGRKLRQQRTESPRRGERIDAALELVEVRLVHLRQRIDCGFVVACGFGQRPCDPLAEQARMREVLI